MVKEGGKQIFKKTKKGGKKGRKERKWKREIRNNWLKQETMKKERTKAYKVKI